MNSDPSEPRRTPRIMVVDDDPICRKAVAAKLAGLSVEVVEASDGAEAFGVLVRQPCDAAIIDLEMPSMNGLHLLGCIRGHEQIRHMPAIVLTAKCDLRSLEQALISGATSFLTKPLNWAAFGAHIKHIIDMSAGIRTANA